MNISPAISVIHKIRKFDDLNLLINEIKTRRSYLEQMNKNRFNVGDSVYFISRKNGGRKMSGTITKINRTRVVVDCGNYRIWTVPVSMLKKGK